MGKPTEDQHRAALVHELAFWRQQIQRPEFTGQQEKNWRATAKHFEAALGAYVRHASRAVLQVGVGVRDSINFMASGPLRVAVDPLAEAYHAEFRLPTFGALHLSAMGEALPFRADCFDGLICMNVLDHCWRPLNVIDEFCRVLRPGGLLFLGVDVFPPNVAQGRRRRDPLLEVFRRATPDMDRQR
jgi:SAM-dependent methyltransferase